MYRLSILLLVHVLIGAAPQGGAVQDPAIGAAFTRIDPEIGQLQTLLNAPIDEARLLLVVRGTPRLTVSRTVGLFPWGPRNLVGVFLSDRSGEPPRLQELAMLDNPRDERTLSIQRFDSTSLVLRVADPQFAFPTQLIKLFFDTGSGRLLKRADFPPEIMSARLVPSGDDLCAVFGGAVGVFACAGADGTLAVAAEWRRAPGDLLMAGPPPDLPPLPQSSYDRFAGARPDRVGDGYSRTGTRIVEEGQGYQDEGDRVWFGKTFYDGEGISGVGGVGYFDRLSQQFVFLDVPELTAWSTSALLVEGDTAWIGLVRHPEGASFSGGLLRYSLSERRSSRLPIPEIITTIARQKGTLYLGTSHGVQVVSPGTLRSFRLEPGLHDRFVIVSETAPLDGRFSLDGRDGQVGPAGRTADRP